jgi:hypothetical protein
LKFLSILLLVLASAPAFAQAHRSDLTEVVGVKLPNSALEGTEAVRVSALTALPSAKLAGFTELLPFALRAPNQGEAGSCLYMSLTGIAEWWLARLHPELARDPEGPIDLSERYLMNVAGLEEGSNGVDNWKTDSVYLFNRAGGAPRNVDYRFTKGWYVRDSGGNVVAANRNAEGAQYDENYNWVDEIPSKAQLVPLPKFQRTVLFADPASNQWNTGVMPADIVDRIKTALRTNKAPVHVIYNHFGYWHATVILGYDDEGDNQNCKFVNRFMLYMEKQAADLRAQAAAEADSAKKEALLKRALKSETAASGTRNAFERGGGCHKGYFYVRDSIYGDPQGPIYHYDPANPSADSPYVKPVVMLEYDWVRTMANHATQITATK